MLKCLGRETEEEKDVLDWLYIRWGKRIRPSGISKDLATAYTILGTTHARIGKVLARGKPYVATTCLLTDREGGFEDATT